MINRKIAMSAVSIVTALALAGGATFAFFSDEATSTANTFGAGSLDLELDDANEPFGGDGSDDVTATFSVTDFAPGDTAAQEISFHNKGTIPVAEIAMGFDATPTDGDADGSDIRTMLNLRVVEGGTASGGECGAGTDVTGTVDTALGDGIAPLTMLEVDGDTYDSLAAALAADNVGTTDEGKVCVEVEFDEDADDDFQGDSASATFTFTAHQDLGQI